MALKDFHIKLPEDHVLFTLPKGKRGDRARELIELGLRLENHFLSLQEEIKLGFEQIQNEIKNIKVITVQKEEKQEENSGLSTLLEGFIDF